MYGILEKAFDCLQNRKIQIQAKPNPPPRKPPETDNNFNMESTWKVATRPNKSPNPQTPSNAEPKKQPETQKATPESRNLCRGKSRNKKIIRQTTSQNAHSATSNQVGLKR
jgi:hypothetical protein